MEISITSDVLESYVFCKYKSYLKLINQQGDKSDYEKILMSLRNDIKRNAIEKIYDQNQENQVVRNVVITTYLLETGRLFLLDGLVEDKGNYISISFDGLKKISGISNLGQFVYIPILFYGGNRVHKEQRLLLELYALFLSQYQAIMPNIGIIWYGREFKTTIVHLNPDMRSAKQALLNIKKMCSAEKPPRLILNKHCHICEFNQRCYDQAVQEDNISLLRGMSEKEIKSYSLKGIFTVTQLAHTFRPRRKTKKATKEVKHRYYALQALALRDKKIYVLGMPSLPTSPVHIYLDIESNPDLGFVYLIGLIVVENGLDKHFSFWADNRNNEQEIFDQFVVEVTQHEVFTVFCYGNHERAFIVRMGKESKNKTLVDKILNSLVNILSLVYAHIYFPTYSNSLKDIGRCIGYSWTETNASGIQSIVWRSYWEADHNVDWKQKLVIYNLEDCIALKKVTQIILIITTQNDLEGISLKNDGSYSAIAFVKDIEKSIDYHKWGSVNFVDPDYEFINKCAYFDYQRERVYVRTSKTIWKSKAQKIQSHNRSLKASDQIVIIASQCPFCHSKEVISGIKKQVRTQEPRVKRSFDIIFTPTGIRRRIIEHRTSIHQCLACGREFIPDQHQRLDKHFHGLKSWVIFHHVAYRISLEALTKMFEELFGICILHNEVYMFKSLMANYYKIAFKILLKNILAGHLLHIDETEVRLQNRKGYVWVFTNLEEVIYIYRPTREGDFLRELLKEFRGVLVSDFYNAYDGIECSQQKCLIHLMRDINQELLNNPFDEELKLITKSFGALLRRIITTIDRYGLIQKHLSQYEAEVDQFFKSISVQNFSSEIAETLRDRLVKYRNKLFTFIKYNGVPWNNNNAEHAIKQFAYYRENNIGILKEFGLSEYLILLSICQTCRYKGASFLNFLLSKEQNLDIFMQRKKQRIKLSDIELYPEGFVPSHFTNKFKKRHTDKNSGAENQASDEIDQ